MGKALKNIGIFLTSIMLTGFIFWLVFLDKQSQENVLEFSLNLLGDKLMAMVPDGNEKASIKNLYDNFVKQATAQEVNPEQVEFVAANILNLSNMDTTLRPQQAEAFLKYSLETPINIDRISNQDIDTIKESKSTGLTKNSQKPNTIFDKKQWADLGDRIQKFCFVNDELQKVMDETTRDMREKQLQMYFRMDKGLKIELDSEIKIRLEEKQCELLSKKLDRLEEDKMLEWRKGLHKDMEQLRREIDALKSLEKLQNLKGLGVLKSLEALKALENLDFIPAKVNVDSIDAIVKKSLKEAGINVKEKDDY